MTDAVLTFHCPFNCPFHSTLRFICAPAFLLLQNFCFLSIIPIFYYWSDVLIFHQVCICWLSCWMQRFCLVFSMTLFLCVHSQLVFLLVIWLIIVMGNEKVNSFRFNFIFSNLFKYKIINLSVLEIKVNYMLGNHYILIRQNIKKKHQDKF